MSINRRCFVCWMTTLLCAAAFPMDAPSVSQAQKQETVGIFYHPSPKTKYVYGMMIKQTTGERVIYQGGIVVFHAAKITGGKFYLQINDNFNYGTSPASLFAAGLPTKRAFFPWSVYVRPERGNKPSPNGTLANLLGRPEDWFFPLLVKSGVKTHERWGKRFQVTFKHIETTDDLLVMTDTRRCKQYEEEYEIVGSGHIKFDLRSGMLKERTFVGDVTNDDVRTKVEIQISRFSKEQLKLLPRLKKKSSYQ